MSMSADLFICPSFHEKEGQRAQTQGRGLVSSSRSVLLCLVAELLLNYRVVREHKDKLDLCSLRLHLGSFSPDV